MAAFSQQTSHQSPFWKSVSFSNILQNEDLLEVARSQAAKAVFSANPVTKGGMASAMMQSLRMSLSSIVMQLMSSQMMTGRFHLSESLAYVMRSKPDLIAFMHGRVSWQAWSDKQMGRAT